MGRALVVVMLIFGCAGCLVTTIVTTKDELLRQDDLGSRTSHRAANVDETQCYVDRHVRETTKAHVNSLWGSGGLLVAILTALGGGLQSPYGVAIAVDGTLAAGYFLVHNRHEKKSERWRPTLDTEYCTLKVTSTTEASHRNKFEPPPPRGPATRDSDGDGITDDKDACTLGAEDKDSFRDDDGCPEDDNDRDGIDDAADKCANEAEDKDGYLDLDGCPDLDNDGDGVPDSVDKCVNAAEDKDGFEDGDGCVDPDNDSDGIVDASDKCRDAAEDEDGFQDDDGCPDPDNDQDGVADVADRCADKLESKNGYQDDDGCPDDVPARVKRIVGTVAGVVFQRDSDLLAPAANGAIGRIATVLAAEKSLHIQIDVTANDIVHGAARAEAIKAALVKKEIDAGRISAVGFAATAGSVDLELVSPLVPGTAPAAPVPK